MPTRIKWESILAFTLMHAAAVAALFMFNWKAFWLFFVMQWLTGGLGVCLCYHRLLTHRSFQVPKFVEYFLVFLGCLAWQNGPIKWVAVHRIHHARSDAAGDPHSPEHGFWWAHMGWLYTFTPEVDQYEKYKDFAPDLAKSPVYRFMNSTFGLYQIPLGILFFALGGWPFVFWGIFFRIVFVWHSTWFVNSAAHTWGYRTWANGDKSTNNWWVAALTYGEGWHNNHHAFPRSAAHGLKWWEVDLTYATIRLLAALKMAGSIQLPSMQQRERLAVRPSSTAVAA